MELAGKPGAEPRVLLVTGAMAAGKSTIAQLVAERLDRAAHVHGDTFRTWIVSGRPPLDPDHPDELDEQLRLRYRQAAHTADLYADAGYVAVVQDVVVGPLLADFVSYVRTRPFGVVVLAPRAEVVAQRELDRPKWGYVGGWTVEEFVADVERDTPRLGLWLDTSDQTPAETVDEIFARLPETLVEGGLQAASR